MIDWNQSMSNYRLSRTVPILVMLVLFMIYGVFFLDEMVSSSLANGIVLEVTTNRFGAQTYSQALVVLSDGAKVSVQLHEPLPAVGDSVPIIVQTYESGDKDYVFDVNRWLK